MESIPVLINSLLNASNFESFKGQLVVALTQIYENGGGGGGGVQTVTGGSVDNTDPDNPVVNAIPLSGTEVGAPLTGVIEVQSGFVAQWTNGDVITRIGFNDDGDFVIERKDVVTNAFSQIFSANPTTPNSSISAYDGTKLGVISISVEESLAKALVNTDRLGFFDKGNLLDAAPQATAIPDATNATDVITSLNSLLVAMRAYGLVAE